MVSVECGEICYFDATSTTLAPQNEINQANIPVQSDDRFRSFERRTT